MNESKWSVEKVREETRKALNELLLPGDKFVADEMDLSYITEDLIDSYWGSAEDKDKACAGDGTEKTTNVACFWGNNWALISANTWAYTNNNTAAGCDPVTEGCLCGSGKRWRVAISSISSRYCANAKNAFMAWPA